MATTVTVSYSHTIGFLANQGRGFNNPVDVALNSSGILYVLNRAGPEVGIRMPYKRVTICTIDQEYLGEFGTGGTDGGQFWWPSSLAFDSGDRLYIADEVLNHISMFSEEGEFLEKWGVAGSGAGELNRPSYITFDHQDNLLISDSLNHRIQRFTKEGQFIEAWGGFGSGPGQFHMPWGICVDFRGQMFVCDWRNDRVQKFDKTGTFLSQWPSPDTDDDLHRSLHRPSAIAVGDQGTMYIADWGNERVQIVSAMGELLGTLRGDSVPSRWSDNYFDANPDEASARLNSNLEPWLDRNTTSAGDESANIEKLFWGPTSVKLDSAGRLYVVDSCRHRLQIYCKGM